jgi:hypothetical protein
MARDGFMQKDLKLNWQRLMERRTLRACSAATPLGASNSHAGLIWRLPVD